MRNKCLCLALALLLCLPFGGLPRQPGAGGLYRA